jgi:2'-5' RNA ligase
MANWVCYALQLPQEARDQIHEWVQAQDWPEGTRLKDPETYHVTVVYSSEGYKGTDYDTFFGPDRMNDWNYTLRVTGTDEFTDSNGKGRPVVLRLVEEPRPAEQILYSILPMTCFRNVCEGVIKEAKACKDFVIPTYDDGTYKPHITVASVPFEQEVPELETPTEVVFMTQERAVELHNWYDRRKGEIDRREVPR